MGNSSSTSRYVTLQADNTSCEAGSPLSGSVLVTVPENIHKSSGDLLIGSSLLFIGKEDVKVQYTTSESDGNNGTRSVTHYDYCKRDIVRAIIPLTLTRNSSNTVNTGSYSIPFQYKIPEDLPSSFYHASHGGHCSIRYKLKLQCKGNDSSELPLQIVSKPYTGPPLPHLVQPVTSPVLLCCCVPKGSITVAANVSNTRIAPGKQIAVDLGAKNESSSQVNVISAVIHQRIHWKANSHSSCANEKITSTMFRVTEDMRSKNKEAMREIQQQKSRGAGGGGARGPSSDDVYREILNAVRDGVNQVTLTIPEGAKHSYMGNLVTITHRLCIKAKTPSCVTDPEINVPLQIVSGMISPGSTPPIYASATPMPTANVYPDGWNPNNVTTIPVVQASYVGPVSYGGNEVTSHQEIMNSANVVPTAPPLPKPTEYNFPNLLKELDSCLSIKFKLEELLTDPHWKSVLSSIQPQEFITLLQKTMMDFDKLDIAQLLCPLIHNFTCSYSVAILRSVSNWMRIQFVQAMLPYIVDLKTNKNVLVMELSDWERISTENDFERALSSRD
eukprot:CCRYP_004546-RA/>CCRYP_004546-RA protein AED:0.02 eAED:0.02 QI:75/1/1/1/1/1/2/200/557